MKERSFVVVDAGTHRWAVPAEQVAHIALTDGARVLAVATPEGTREVWVRGRIEICSMAAGALCPIPIRPLRAVDGWRFAHAVVDEERVLFLVADWVGHGE